MIKLKQQGPLTNIINIKTPVDFDGKKMGQKINSKRAKSPLDKENIPECNSFFKRPNNMTRNVGGL